MKAIKIINIFKAKENIPFMTCLITCLLYTSRCV
ncbi:hypothetical protein AZ044_003401 [Pluralibacter gergoviae]|nr:hypothetical protein AZ044_003401 [Pluralibacter gergoviae]